MQISSGSEPPSGAFEVPKPVIEYRERLVEVPQVLYQALLPSSDGRGASLRFGSESNGAPWSMEKMCWRRCVVTCCILHSFLWLAKRNQIDG